MRTMSHPHVHQPAVQLVGIACQISDRALLWLMVSHDTPEHQQTVVQHGPTFHCTCQEGQSQPAACLHQAAVRVWLSAQEHQRHEQERQRHEAAARRERALLWTDDRPFSIYKL